MDIKTINVLRSIDILKKDSKITAQEFKKIDIDGREVKGYVGVFRR